ncbi:MAG: outer membrane beta-barrel protein [Terriglobales bacterium]
MSRASVFVVFAITLFIPAAAWSQMNPAESYRDLGRYEVYVGYSRMTGSLGLNGWEASGAYKPQRAPWFGVVADVSGHYGVEDIATIRVKSHMYNYLAGPEVYFTRLRNQKVVPFGHLLFGASEENTDIAGVSFNGVQDTAFTWALGGGVDYRFGNRIYGRAKLDLVRTHFLSEGDTRGRYGFGVVYRF